MKKCFLLVILLLLSCALAQNTQAPAPKYGDKQPIKVSNSINWAPYMRNLEQKIKNNWAPPKKGSMKRVKTQFTIHRDGTITDIKITGSSGDVLVDSAAKAAIEASSPVEPLPKEFKGESVPIEFTFDYNVLLKRYDRDNEIHPAK